MMYYSAWGVYLATALALTGVCWYRTRVMAPGFLRGNLRWVVTCILLIPARSGLDTVLLAPAWVVAGFGLASEGQEVAMLGARPLAAGLVLGIAVVTVTSLVRLARGTGRPAPQVRNPAQQRRTRRKPQRRRRR